MCYYRGVVFTVITFGLGDRIILLFQGACINSRPIIAHLLVGVIASLTALVNTFTPVGGKFLNILRTISRLHYTMPESAENYLSRYM